MKVDNSLGMFDITVAPVALYAVEHWGILSLPRLQLPLQRITPVSLGFFSTRNQKLCRLLLSCHKKRWLVMLGELGSYPSLIKALVQTSVA